MPTRRFTLWDGVVWAMLILSLLVMPAFAEKSEQPNNKPIDGAADPNLPGNLGPAVVPAYTPALLDIAVGLNVLVNDRMLCPNGRGLQQNETSIAVSGDVVVAAFNDARGGQAGCPTEHAAVGWAYSLDGGATFTDGGTLPQSTHFNNGDPWVGVSPDGQTFYLSGLWDFYRGFGFYRGRATQDGFAWDEPVVISFGTGTHDKEAFVVDRNTGNIYMSYTLFGTGAGIKMTRSYDGGDTWTQPVNISNSGQGSFPAIDNYGIIYVAYNAGSQIAVARSLDDGDSFQTAANFPLRLQSVPFMDRSPSFPQVAVDLSGGDRDGWVYVVYQSLSPENVLRPYIAHSEDFGATWTAPTAINTDDVNTFHWWPSVSVDDYGNVNVIFFDRRLNPGTALTDLFFAQSTDGGNTFTDVRVTDVSGSWSGIRYDPGFTYNGDYIRAISYGTDVYAVWTDPRNGDPDIYFSRVNGAAIALRSRDNLHP